MKRVFSLLLAAVMVFGMLPVWAFAAEPDLGTVHVIVQNSKAPTDDPRYWTDDAAPWKGIRAEADIPLKQDSSMASCIEEAVLQLGDGHRVVGANTGYISEIDGLKAGVGYSGWMATLNDWFTNEGIGEFKVSNGKLEAGDVICADYTLTGSDLGGNWEDNTKTLKGVTIQGAELSGRFSGDKKEYTLTLPEGQKTGKVTLAPTAFNKNFQVRTYKGETYNVKEKGFKPNAQIQVAAGDTLWVVVGDPSWPSMNEAGSVPAGVYQFRIEEKSDKPVPGFADYFQSLKGFAEVQNDAVYPFAVDEAKGALQSSNQKQGSSKAVITLTFQKAAELSFRYQCSTEKASYGTSIYDKFLVKLDGTQKLLDGGVQEGFQKFSLNVPSGSKVTLSYEKDSSGDKGEDCVWLKDFAAKAISTVTFPNMPQNAKITVKRGEEILEPGADGKSWLLTAGDYTYSASCFGYKSAENVPFHVEQTDLAVPGGLERLASAKVTFSCDPKNANVTLTQGDVTLTAEPDGSYLLPVSQTPYHYEISAAGYVTKTGNVTVSDETAQTVDGTLTKGAGWDGTVQEPSKEGQVFQIGTAAELAWFAQKVNGGDTAVSGVLTADVRLSDPAALNSSWTPIGNIQNPFAGQFDGQGHTVEGLYIHDAQKDAPVQGLFGAIAENGMICNLILKNADVNTQSTVGAVAGKNAGTIRCCGTKGGSLTGGGSNVIGGIAGHNSGLVEMCFNEAGVENQGLTVGDYAAGVVGENLGRVLDCYNLGTVKGYKVAGIAGFGRTGVSEYTIENCYNGGKLDAGLWNVYHISCYSKRSNCYHINTNASNNHDSNSAEVTEGGVKNLAALLGGAFENTEDGRLHLLWENPKAAYTVTITAKPENAEVTLTKDGQPQTGTADKGVHTFSKLSAGTYRYTVSYEKGDCKPQSGEILLNGRNASLTAQLEPRTYNVVFTLNPKDAVLTLKQGEQTIERGQVNADAGTVTYQLPNGTYSYTAEKFGYSPVSGQVTVDKAAKNETVTLAKTEGANVTFDITASDGKTFYEGDPRITVKNGDHTETPANHQKLYLPAGEYSYTVEAATFQKLEGTLTVGKDDQTLQKTMQYSKVWDGKTAITPKLEGTVYQISSGYELAGFRDLVNEQTEKNQSCNLNAILLDNIDLGGHSWVPIAHDKTTGFASPEFGYTGEFNGNGKTISGLNVQMEGQKRAGLFGTVAAKDYGEGKGAGSIHDLTVAGTVKAEQYAGGIAAYVFGTNVAIHSCTSNVTVTAADGYAAGVVGYLQKNARVEGCTNRGAVTARRTSAGVVGNATNALPVTNCANYGTITATSTRIGGVVGSSSKVPIENCVNHGTINGSDCQTGGVVGFTNSSVDSCYNTGAVIGKSKDKNGVGGIAGILNYTGSSLKNSYNTGVITDAEGGQGVIGALAGNKSENGIQVLNCYFLESSCKQGLGGAKQDDADEMTACKPEQLRSLKMAALLGGGFAAPKDAGEPILGFESSDARFVTFFRVTPEDAAVEVEKASAAEPGVYVLAPGSYRYTVSKTGYGTVSDTLEVQKQSRVIPVELKAETFHVTFRVNPADAVVTVKDQDGQVQTAQEGKYALPKGTYTYTAEKFGYESVNGTFTVEDRDLTLDPIDLKESAKYPVKLEITYEGSPADTTVEIFSGEAKVGDGESLNLPDGTYTYRLIASGYFNAEGTFRVEGKAVNVKVNLQLRTTWDGSKQEPKKSGDVYQITGAEELAWLAENLNSGAISNGANAILLADIVINDEKSANKWVPIGDYDHQYTGTFDGNGKAVKGLDNALFGYGGEGSMIQNVTVYGTVTGSSNRGGICTASGGSFENCANYANVTATGQRVGGIVGVLYSAGSIKNCVNYGNITTSFKAPQTGGYYAHIGGVAGYAYGPVEGSVNHGTVSDLQKTDGGIGGIVGETLSTVTDCYNMGTVTGCTGTGGVAGIADEAKNKLENCYNAGAVRATNEYPSPHVGAVVGDIGATDGATVGQVVNCYYLENSYYHDFHGTILNGGVGYGRDTTVKKTEAQMKEGAFALSLGKAYHADSDTPINQGYPVLKWQGGKAPGSSEDQQAVAADKLALTVTPTTVTEAMTLKLTTAGEHGSKITWKSSNAAVISDTGVVTLPAEGSQQVTLTATITKGTVSDTRDFVILVQSRKLVDQTALNTLVAAMGGVRLKPVHGSDTNINAVMQSYVKAVAAEKMPELDASGLTVTLTAVGENANHADTDSHIGKDGTIHYFYQDPASAIMNGAVVKDIGFRISYHDAQANCTAMANIPWDGDKVRQAMDAIAQSLTFDVIKGENTSADQVTKSLTLPVRLENYGWSTISWQSSHAAVAVKPGTGVFAPSTGMIYPESKDTQVTLTATITFNRTVAGEPEIVVTKQIPVTVPGSASQVDATIQAALEKYTMEKLTDFRTHKPIDPQAVTGDISLLSPRKLGIDGKDYAVSVTAQNDAVTVNGYRANVYRPLPDTDAVEVPLTVTITHKATGKSQSKELGTVTVQPLTRQELNAEEALMERVIANFAEGIRKDNADLDHVTGDLRSFQEVYEKDGELVWVYKYTDRTDTGIVPTDLPKDGYDESYNLFHSSEPTIIQHENLLLKRVPAENTQVTITACLSSQEYARYAKRYPDDAQLKKLADRMVSVTVTVLGNGEDQKKANEVEALIDAIGDVTLGSEPAIAAARKAYDGLTPKQKGLVSPEHLHTLQLAEQILAILKQPAADVDAIYRHTGDLLEELLRKTPDADRVWTALALARSGRRVPEAYYGSAEAYLKEAINDREQLSTAAEHAEWILVLTSMGRDVTRVAGHNLLQALSDMDFVQAQGIAGTMSVLTALDCHRYEIPAAQDGAEQTTREKLVKAILDAQLPDGGWALKDTRSSADTTALALVALAPYYETQPQVKTAVDKALDALSRMQNAVGSFGPVEEADSHTCAQVIHALTELGIDPAKDARFLKNGKSPVEALCRYAGPEGFCEKQGETADVEATEIAYGALAAYFRHVNGQNPLFDMRDVKLDVPVDPVEPPKPTEPSVPELHTHSCTWYITKLPTETQPGRMEGTCACGESLTLEIPVLGSCGHIIAAAGEGNAFGGRLEDDAILFAVPLTDEEARAVAAGADLTVTLELKDVADSLSDAEKTAIRDGAAGASLGLYLKAAVYKQVGDGEPVSLDLAEKPVKLSLVLPENLRSRNRAYGILRLSSGNTTALNAAYDDQTGKLIFTAEPFGVFALAYRDGEHPAPSKPNVPATGDESGVFALMFLGSLLALEVLWWESRKRKHTVR